MKNKTIIRFFKKKSKAKNVIYNIKYLSNDNYQQIGELL